MRISTSPIATPAWADAAPILCTLTRRVPSTSAWKPFNQPTGAGPRATGEAHLQTSSENNSPVASLVYVTVY